jgi:hypothetical protein
VGKRAKNRPKRSRIAFGKKGFYDFPWFFGLQTLTAKGNVFWVWVYTFFLGPSSTVKASTASGMCHQPWKSKPTKSRAEVFGWSRVCREVSKNLSYSWLAALAVVMVYKLLRSKRPLTHRELSGVGD